MNSIRRVSFTNIKQESCVVVTATRNWMKTDSLLTFTDKQASRFSIKASTSWLARPYRWWIFVKWTSQCEECDGWKMRNFNGLSVQKSATLPPSSSAYLGYLTSKQLQQYGKFKRDHDSDKESLISGYSARGRRSKIRQANWISLFVKEKTTKKVYWSHSSCRSRVVSTRFVLSCAPPDLIRNKSFGDLRSQIIWLDGERERNVKKWAGQIYWLWHKEEGWAKIRLKSDCLTSSKRARTGSWTSRDAAENCLWQVLEKINSTWYFIVSSCIICFMNSLSLPHSLRDESAMKMKFENNWIKSEL